MEKVKCKLLGPVRVTEGEMEVYIPSGKVSALFFYLVVKKIATREELGALLWPEVSEENAKNSLRNTLHKLKKIFACNLFLTPNKSMIVLNDAVELELDIDIFSKSRMEHLNLYSGEFLEGISFRDAPEYEYWLLESRNHYRELYIKSATAFLSELSAMKKYDEMESLIKSLLSIDNFNETAYQYLMVCYKAHGRYDKIINEYYQLQKLLEENLGVSPCKEIEESFQEAMSIVKKKDNSGSENGGELFVYRDFELAKINEILNSFREKDRSTSFLIKGESGIGKTTLKKNMVESNKDRFIFLETRCFRVEHSISYSTWMKLIDQIETELERQHLAKPVQWKNIKNKLFQDIKKETIMESKILENWESFNEDLLFKLFQNVFVQLGQNKKIVIIIEDIQWMDPMSLNLLLNLILNGNKNALYCLTGTDEDGGLTERKLAVLSELRKMAVIELRRFSPIEVANIISRSLKGVSIPQEIADEIYSKSKGNAFFLKVYIEAYRNNFGNPEGTVLKKLKTVLEEKFAGFSEMEMKVLKLVSVFYGDVKLDFLMDILDIKAFKLIDILNDLVRHNILEEKNDGGLVTFIFTNSSYKDFIYSSLNDTEKIILHGEIADTLERKLSSKGDVQTFVKLRYHFELAQNKTKALQYEVYMLHYHLNFNHELFPSMDDFELRNQIRLNLSNEKALKWISEAEDKIRSSKNQIISKEQEKELEQTELLFLYCKGRFLIRCGNYTEGTRVMRLVISLATQMDHLQTGLLGHKQMIIYGIQINDAEIMLNHIIDGLKAAKKLNDSTELGVFYRLYGVYHLMNGKGDMAEELFNKSIDLFQSSGRITNISSVNLAASYNYIGEIRKSAGALSEAIGYFGQAIDLCQSFEPASLSLFYLNAGISSFLMGRLDEMAANLNKAEQITDDFDSFWKKPVLEALIALLKFNKRDFGSALYYLKKSTACVQTINNSRDLGMVYFVQAIIRQELGAKDINQGEALKEFLNESANIYFYQALKYLDQFRDKAEINYLKKLL